MRRPGLRYAGRVPAPDVEVLLCKPLRADAARNRARILQAAQVVFAERGLDVTLDDIAREAGLGVGTLYRRFADREALVEALFDERMQRAVARASAALEVPDAWQGLTALIESTCEELAVDRGLHQVMLSSAYGQDRVARSRAELVPLIEALVRRAQAQGTLRPDFQAHDIPVFFLMIGAAADFSREVSPDLWRRYLRFLVDGMRAVPGQIEVPLAAALCDAELDAARCAYRPRRR